MERIYFKPCFKLWAQQKNYETNPSRVCYIDIIKIAVLLFVLME